MTRFDVRMIAGAAALAAVFAATTAGATLAEESPWDHGSVWGDESHVTVPAVSWPASVVWGQDGNWDDGGWDDGYHGEGGWDEGSNHDGGWDDSHGESHDDHGYDD